MNTVLQNILTSNHVISASGESIPLRGNIDALEGQKLQAIVRDLKPKTSVEIGFAFGISALYICEALAEQHSAHHILIDPFQSTGWQNIGWLNLERAGLSTIAELRESYSHEALARLVAEEATVDFAFVDGAHTFDYVLLDFVYLDRLLSVGGIIVFDDVGYPSIQKVLRFILTNRNYRVYGLETEHSLNWRRRLIYGIGRLPLLKRLLASEYTLPNQLLGFQVESMIAIEKLSHDERHWTFHQPF